MRSFGAASPRPSIRARQKHASNERARLPGARRAGLEALLVCDDGVQRRGRTDPQQGHALLATAADVECWPEGTRAEALALQKAMPDDVVELMPEEKEAA
jgi:hypothetical protein